MGSIELRVLLLAGTVAGVIMLLAEVIAMHRKVAMYRDHLRILYQRGRFSRILAEIIGIVAFAAVQPIVVCLLLSAALDNFTPQFSAHAMQQLKYSLQHGTLGEALPPAHSH